MEILISEKTQQLILQWLKKYPEDQKQAAIIFALTKVQEDNGGWLSQALIEAVARFLNMPPIVAFEVATFYSMFELKPVGKHKVSICTNISCMLCGCEPIAAHIKKRLQIDWNETTKDGLFTLKEVECLAACGGAPAMLIDKQYYENLSIASVDKILNALQAEELVYE